MNIWAQAGHRLQTPASTCLAAYRTCRAEPSVAHLLQRSASKKTPFSKKLQADQSDIVARALRNKGSLPKTVLESLRQIVASDDQSTEKLTRKQKRRLRLLEAERAEQAKPKPSDNAYARLSSLAPEELAGALPDFLGSTGVMPGTWTTTMMPELNSESAVTDWGEDKLKPRPFKISETPAVDLGGSLRLPPLPQPPPHIKSPLVYSRRIEGLLEPSEKATLEDVKPHSAHNPIAKLAHGLDRVLFNPGVHWLQDPRSRVYNFSPYLESIPKVTDFAFERLSGFIKSSRDEDLWDLARRENRTFAGSTSSLSGMLSHIYFLLSGDKDVNTDNLSRHFGKELRNFTAGQRMPASVIMNYNNGIYTIDSDSDSDVADKNILTWMGTLLEKYLTVLPEEFASYMRSNPAPSQLHTDPPLRDAYRYAKSDRFVMRSQLDCHDPRLPGTGVFDIKTRACLPIRMDLLNFEENSGYLIRSQTGKVESFEREYYDLIRSAFLKYSFQVRIGNMDGVIVAYHNTARMFGFQYISLQEMDEALFGAGAGIGDRVFAKCVGILEQVAEEIVGCFPRQSVKCTFEKLERRDVMNVFVQPLEWEGEEEEQRPIRQLEVKVSNYLGQDPVRGSTAVSSVDQPWTAHWSIAKLAPSAADIHEALQSTKERQFRFFDIPTGWDPDSVGQFWNNLSFSGQVPSGATAEQISDKFRIAGTRIKDLRRMARSGREETERLASEEEGKKKVWIGGEVEESGWYWMTDMLQEEDHEAPGVAVRDVGEEAGEEEGVGEVVEEAIEKEALADEVEGNMVVETIGVESIDVDTEARRT